MLTPPFELAARLRPEVFDLCNVPGDASLQHPTPIGSSGLSRRRFLSAAAGLSALMAGPSLAGPIVFKMDVAEDKGVLEPRRTPAGAAPTSLPATNKPPTGSADVAVVLPERVEPPPEHLARGEIPADFWERPRILRLQRQGSKSVEVLEYWRDGKINAKDYWKACHILRDVRADMMTYMDPSLLDLLRGITGYYEAWDWKAPIIITSGYRTEQTNNRLSREGAAKNSMHLYGKAADLYMEKVPSSHLVRLGKHFQRGGVGFYPSRGFIHLDTGKVRSWRG